jgi:hypothetical protein
MKTKILFVVFLLAAFAAVPAHAQVEYYPDELAYYDAQIAVLLPHLETYQDAYYAANDQYYQALASHSVVPDVPVPPDGLSDAPTDQFVNLAYFWDAAALPDALAWSFRIDTYSGPDGDGYVLVVTTQLNGDVWTRALDYGPESWRGNDWYQIIPEE